MSSRKGRAQTARETLEILETGSYQSPNGGRVDLSESLNFAIENSQLYAPQQYPEVFSQRDVRRETNPCRGPTRFEVINGTTLAASRKLVEEEHREDVLCLNFASAKNPGGGFLNGSQAQEESLARASGLYACINPLQAMYETNRRYTSSLYTDHMIHSPQVPVFRDDDDVLLDRPWRVSMLTAPAVNAGAVRKNEPDNISRIQETMIRRIEKLLSIAVVHGHCTLVLGAWGCGVFQNSPSQVAQWFHYHLLENGTFCNTFAKVVFAVLDHSQDGSTIAPFRERFA